MATWHDVLRDSCRMMSDGWWARLHSCSVSAATECRRNLLFHFELVDVWENRPADHVYLLKGSFLYQHGGRLSLLQWHPGRKAEVHRLLCTTCVTLSLACKALNDAEGDKSPPDELRSEAYACRPAASGGVCVPSASSLTPEFSTSESTLRVLTVRQTELSFTALL